MLFTISEYWRHENVYTEHEFQADLENFEFNLNFIEREYYISF